jgi:hypothetical protein
MSVKLIDMVGKGYINSYGTSFIIVEYVTHKNVTVQFQDKNKCIVKTRMHNIRLGSVPNPYDNTVIGVGCIGRGKYLPTDGRKATIAYEHWRGMLLRCYCNKTQDKFPTYKGFSVCDEWLIYQNFADWFYCQEFYECGYQLDKDILKGKFKVYSAETCCMIPREINNMFNTNSKNKGKYPQGVQPYNDSGRFDAKVKVSGKYKYLGVFDTPEQAFSAYKIGKEARVKEVALKWEGKIEERVFQVLMDWELN